MRIVAGKWKGRKLVSPEDLRVRPTAEDVRDGMITAIAADLPKARVLDLYAGTGALALEAMSRGAKRADFVETRGASLHALRANIANLRLLQATRVFKRDALQFAGALEAGRYEIAFVDPPYGSRQLDRVIMHWQATGFARVLVAEHARTHELPAGAERLLFDDTAVTIYRV